jgi:hypothetical protein
MIEVQADARPCRDTECSGVAEPEVDGEHRYWECQECGFAFAYERIENPMGGECAIGVPEEVRRRASAPMEQAMREEQRGKPVVVQLGRKP